MSFIIKVTQNGSSREYLFNRPGPIVVGSDSACDLVLEDAHMEPKLLEVKLSGERLVIKELGRRAELYLSGLVLPYREETPYKEGEILTLQNLGYQIQIRRVAEEEVPPPFSENDFKQRLERMSDEFRHREKELKRIVGQAEKKELRLRDLDDRCQSLVSEKNRLSGEVTLLKSSKTHIEGELKDRDKEYKSIADKEALLKGHIERLELEERTLKEKILTTNQSLSRLLEEREAKSKEMDRERLQLSELKASEVQLGSRLSDLKALIAEGEAEVRSEEERLQAILRDTERRTQERRSAEVALNRALGEKTQLDLEVEELKAQLTSLTKELQETEGQLREVRAQIKEGQGELKEIQEKIGRHREEESGLQSLNADLRTEIEKAQGKLRLKKDQFNQVDFECQDTFRRLTTAHFELERVENQLKELSGEEKARELKVLALREEIEGLSRKGHEEKKKLHRETDEERHKQGLIRESLQHEINERKKDLALLEEEHKGLINRHEALHNQYQRLQQELKDLKVKIDSESTTKELISREVNQLRHEAFSLTQEKSLREKDLALLKVKLNDLEIEISEREEGARVELETMKREERARLLAEKEVILSEVEALKQRSLIEVDASFRKQQEDLHHLKLRAQEEAAEIRDTGVKIAEDLHKKARERLEAAHQDAEAREKAAHDRMREAQVYFKQKEDEAHALIRKTEVEIRADLNERKKKLKEFIQHKQTRSLAAIEAHQEQSYIRMQRNEERGLARIEHLKRKELKRVAQLRDEEASRLEHLRQEMLKDVNEEKDRTRRALALQRSQQEAELADTKRKVLEHINQSKFSQQSAWEEELKRERQQYEQTKKARIENATQAMVNLMIAEFGVEKATDEASRARIQETLGMAFDGQKAQAMKEVGQVLNLNPELRKRMLPVMKKYALRFGVPAAVALVIFADLGSVRSMAVDYTRHLIKQQNSASDIFVQQQKVAWKEKYTFNPETSIGYKETFTDNVLYTTDFETVMDNEEFQNSWILRVHDFMVKDLELSEDVAINYISAEGTLVKDLVALKKEITPQFKDQGIAKLTAAEEAQLGWLKEKIPDPSKLERFREMRKGFFNTFHAEKFPKRGVAAE